MIKRLSACLLVFAFVIVALTGCGETFSSGEVPKSSGKALSSESRDEGSVAKDSGGIATDSANTQSNAYNSGHKIIMTGDITLETLKFEETIDKITDYIESKGGYIESSNILRNSMSGYDGTNRSDGSENSLRTATYTFRIPQIKYSKAFKDFKSFGNITSEQSVGEDITDQYFDTQAHLKTLRVQEQRVLALLSKAGKMSDILTIEKQLQSLRYKIESYTGTIRKWNSLINFATINITVDEVEEIKTVSPTANNGLFSRIAYGFTDSVKQLWVLVQNVIVVFVIVLPYLAVTGAILLIVLYFRKRMNKKATK